MFEKEAEGKNESSNRRRFFRKLVGLAAIAGIGGASLAGSTRKVYAADTESLLIGMANSGSSTTTLTASPSGTPAFKVETTSATLGSAAIYGYASSSASGTKYGVFGRSDSISGIGIRGWASTSTGLNYGISGESSSVEGRGVYGLANTSTGITYGVYGQSDSVDGRGVYGNASNASGYTRGVHGESSSINGYGVYGIASNASGVTYGVYGISSSIDGRGVYGFANNLSGITSGVHGESDSISGRGVYGNATNASGQTRGVYGLSSSIEGRGVEGYSNNTTGRNAGVYGHSSRGAGVVGGADNYNAIPIIAWGASGQTQCLQEWINSSFTTLAVIDKAGFLGVGTGSPTTPIHVKSSSSNPAVRLENEGDHVGQFIYCFSSSGHIPFFSGRRARGTIASPSAVQTDDTLMRYGGAGYAPSGFPSGNRAILEFKAAQNWTDAAQGTYIIMSTTPTGSTGTLERMRITSDGRVGIGLTNPSYQLQLSTDSAAKPSTNTWTVASDSRLKDTDSIKPFTMGSDLIKRLPQPVWFRYTKESGLPSDMMNVGWIAQDIASVAPFMVRRTRQKLRTTDETETETLSLNTNELPYAVVNSLKEIFAKLDELQIENQTLKDKNKQIEEEIKILKQTKPLAS